MNKIADHTSVSIPTHLLEHAHNLSNLIKANHWENNEQRLHYIDMFTQHMGDIVIWILEKHYLAHGTKDVK